MNPPADDGLQLLALMRQGVNQYHTIQVRAAKIRVRPLSCSENSEITADVAATLAQLPREKQNRITEEIELAKAMLVRASTSDVNANDPKLTDYLLSLMTVHEILALFKSYNGWLESIDPSIEDMSKDELDALVTQVKKSPSQLTELSRWELLNIARCLLTPGDLPEAN